MTRLQKALEDALKDAAERRTAPFLASQSPEIQTREPFPSAASAASAASARVRADSTVLSHIIRGGGRAVKSPGARPTDLAAIIQPQPQSADTRAINESPPLPPAHIAQDLLNTVYRHTQCRYPFTDWTVLRQWHDRREEIVVAGVGAGIGAEEHQVGSFFIWMAYAVGAQLVTRYPELESPASYFQQACKHMEAVMALSNLTTVRALLFVLFYAFRSQGGPPLYLFSGHVMRLCLEYNLHRRAAPGTDLLVAENRKRIFWSAYCLDRLIGLASGRPFSVSDIDIDIELPLDIMSDCTDPVVIAAQAHHSSRSSKDPAAPIPITDMTSAIHVIRHYQFRSKAHTILYARNVQPPSHQTITELLSELEAWRRQIPTEASGDIPVHSQHKFQMMYFQAVLLTLRPAVVHAGPRDQVLVLCASVAAEACEVG